MRLLILVWLVASVSLAQMDHVGHSMGSQSMKALEGRQGKAFEIAWMSQMIEHHQGAVEMAQSVLKAGKNPKVKSAASAIVATQSKEIKQLTGWLKEWHNATPDKTQTLLMRQDMKPMLEAARGSMPGMNMASDPDKAFLEGMIPHHQGAVDMSKLALKKSIRKELNTFAQTVIVVQNREIKQYQGWLKAWK